MLGHPHIVIETVPKRYMRYDTQGDWYADDAGVLHIQISADVKPDEQFLYALHELIEWRLCLARGITQKQVDEFDIAYEQNRKTEGRSPFEEPGDDPAAPYRKEHRFACLIEHLMAHELGMAGYGEVR